MRGLVTFGEVRSAPDAEALREAYGVRPMDWYASGEIMLIAWECPSGRGYHVNADSVVVEVVDRDGRPPPPGERGEVVVTALNNRTTPIVRYRIGDIGVLLVDPCPCGITLPLMGPIEGRTPDWIVGPGGRRISPFRVVLGVLLGGEVVNTVRRYRITQWTTSWWRWCGSRAGERTWSGGSLRRCRGSSSGRFAWNAATYLSFRAGVRGSSVRWSRW